MENTTELVNIDGFLHNEWMINTKTFFLKYGVLLADGGLNKKFGLEGPLYGIVLVCEEQSCDEQITVLTTGSFLFEP